MPAQAEIRRLAILVGHNVGGGARPPLRYAEADAAKLASVLSELGDVASRDIVMLQGQDLPTVRAALADVARRVAALRATPNTRVVLLFYFSGHSDGVALELGTERLPYAALREWLDSTKADVRLAIVDSCRSGALLRIKGGRPGPSFELRLTDELHSSGHALLTSSAEDELALESREVGGSLFTHHLVSGLRGAADSSGDGLVTLGEAYQYAYAHTVSATADVLLGGQHPAYDYRLSGKGELVLTQLPSPGTALELPSDFERALLLRPERGQVMAELGPGAVPRLAVPPGEYELRAWRAGRQHRGFLRAPAGQVKRVRWEDLAPVAASASAASTKGLVEETSASQPARSVGPGFAESGDARPPTAPSVPASSTSASLAGFSPSGSPGDTVHGEAEAPASKSPSMRTGLAVLDEVEALTSAPRSSSSPTGLSSVLGEEQPPAPVPHSSSAPMGISMHSEARPPARPTLAVRGGVRQSVAKGMGALQALRLELSGLPLERLVLSVELGRGARPVGREAAGAMALGYRWALRRGPLEASASAEAGVQFIRQSTNRGVAWALAPGLGPAATLSWDVTPRVAVQLGAHAPCAFLKQDGQLSLRLLPGAGLGMRLGL
nr:caspase family protein [Pyxidicoccus fallax]